LIQLGFRVYGLGGDYTNCPLNNVNFRPVACDLADPAAVEAACQRILETEKGVCLVVNNAKYFGRNAFLNMGKEEIERVLRINLLCPLIIVRTLAESLKTLQGYLIQLGAPYAETSRGGAAGAAASGGLKWMGEVLFHELREHGVKVCHLSPEPNRSGEPAGKGHPGARVEAVIDPEAVAQAIEQILQSPFGNVVTEMILRPLRTREPQQEPVRKLPYPDPKPIPYTVPREFIEAEEQLEEEDRKKEADRQRKRRKAKKAAKKAAPKKAAPKQSAEEAPAKADSPPEKASGEEQPAAKARRRSRRKPRPPKVEVGFLEKPAAGNMKEAPASKDPGEPKPARKAAKKATKKAAAKKAARKTARKAAAKKEAAKDSGDKPAKKAVKKAARKTARKKVSKSPDTGKNPA
jgi:NAD(P)-dependent dehydrogenase (short-subunit alcohol dehydrogenase family)